MAGPEQLIRTAVTLPFAIARRVVGIAAGLLPGSDGREPAPTPTPTPDVDIEAVVADTLSRDRAPVERGAPTPEEELGGHVETEVELVAESADLEATEPAGPELHVDEPWEGYRRMKVAEIRARLEGQPAEVLAAVELYESTHRKRVGVLKAVRAASRA